jgi:hypothetical protein
MVSALEWYVLLLWKPRRIALLNIIFVLGSLAYAQGQAVAGQPESESCSLKNHVYTCDSAAFKKKLDSAATFRIETQNTDGVAREQLQSLVTRKLGRTLAPQNSVPDLIFLLLPTGVDGVNISPGEVDLGTLRVYTASPDGTRAHLVWAEDFTGQQDLPWPFVVRALISRFQAHFGIK